MSTPPSAYFQARPELQVSRAGHESTKDRSDPVPTPFWAVERGPSTDQADQVREMASIYARPGPIAPYVDDVRMQEHRYGLRAGSPITLQPFSHQHTETQSSGDQCGVQATAVGISYLGPQVRHFPGAAVPSHDRCSRPRSTSSGMSPGLRYMEATNRDISETSALGVHPPETWDSTVASGYAPPTPSFVPAPVRAWEPSERNNDNRATIEPAPLYHVDGDVTAPISCCEWTDERGVCNMDVIGDRVWMSHHLSRVHDVVGHEKTPRACLWQGCTDVMNKGSLARHVVSRHLRAGASCGFCSKVYSRADVARRHTKKCKVANEMMGEQAESQAEG